MSDDSLLPDADPDGFISWLEREYIDDRWSDVYTRGRSVTVWSGEHPAFTRFIADIRPRLHKHGFIISDVRKDVPKTIDGEMEHVHWISAVPIAYAVAEYHGYICDRSACTNLIQDAWADYCEECSDIFPLTDPDDNSGLYSKYEVYKNGEQQDDCFVLKPASDPAAWVALNAYRVVTDDEELAADLNDWLVDLSDAHSTGVDRGRGIRPDGDTPDPDAFRIPTVEELDEMRVAAGLSQRDLSRQAGLEQGRFNSILHHDYDPQTSTIRALLEVLQNTDPRSEEEIERRGPKPTPSPVVEDQEDHSEGEDPAEKQTVAGKLSAMDKDDLQTDGGVTTDESVPPDLDGDRPDWSDELIGFSRRGIEIIDVKVGENVLGRDEIRVQTEHHNSDQRTYRKFTFSKDGLGWKSVTRDPPQICERVIEFLEDEKPLLRKFREQRQVSGEDGGHDD